MYNNPLILVQNKFLTDTNYCKNSVAESLQIEVTKADIASSLTYNWQDSIVGNNAFLNINGVNTNLYQPTTNNIKTSYYRVLVSESISGCNSTSILSGKIIVNDNPTITSIGKNLQTTQTNYCLNGVAQKINFTYTIGQNLNLQNIIWYKNNIQFSTDTIIYPATQQNIIDNYFVKIYNNKGCVDSSNRLSITILSKLNLVVSTSINRTYCQSASNTGNNIAVTATSPNNFKFKYIYI